MPLNPSNTDTIAAVSTPLGVAGIGIVRISGPDAKSICKEIFKPKKSITNLQSHRLYLGYLYDRETGSTIDEVLVSYMAAPHSYTREDVVEINTHSGYLLLSRILEIIIKEGARPAEPGEFTFRAFMNGRIDLTQAEAMMDLIHAQSERGVYLSTNQMRGSFRLEVEHLRQRAIDCLARIELLIDYPDENQAAVPDPDEIGQKLIKPLEKLIASHEEERVWIKGVGTAIVGRVNAGKSSLLNRLVKEERALVSSIPGTTRDVIESTIYIRGLPLRLMDTAGFRLEKGILEKKGMEKTIEKMQEAELILFIVDRSRPLNKIDMDILARIRKKQTLVVLNKIDLPSKINRAALLKALGGLPLVETSALIGNGIEELRRAIRMLVLSRKELSPDNLLAPNIRQKEALGKAYRSFVGAAKNLELEMPLEIIAEDINDALAALGEIGGETATEEVLDRIFSRFCLGK
ncbi:MAG: tRNA uridine-5-carboxymethylaminomethyl(34) synthesis GTPase MnmE [Deltaproteobacteria bacterium]|nr:tRNA uridine-5-carboxymethylaminomethyl(34) synthesis GTPase MnmE [Deltaproteobacteria bacterium]